MQLKVAEDRRNAPPTTVERKRFDVAVVGGFGHVGLPLAVSLAGKGRTVCALDINPTAQQIIDSGRLPFAEAGCQEILERVLADGTFFTSLDQSLVASADVVIVVIGTPVDSHLNPEFKPILTIMDSLCEHLVDGQLVVLRSTVYPGTTDRLKRMLEESGKNVEIAFCPERIAEGHAMEELQTLPQIISSYSPDGYRRCRELFAPLTADAVELSPLEAELAKLFTNTWRYTLFATANQFFMLANDHGADFYRIHHAMTHNYPRAQALPQPGFAAGPCLFKDTMQLAAFNNNRFYLGHAAMLVNEGLPNYLVDRMKRHHDLSQMTVGILGMTFKGGSDDTRESLSYKLRKVLEFECKAVLCSDEYVREPGFVSAAEAIERCDAIVLATPHPQYRDLRFRDETFVIDVWNMWGNGCVL